MIKSLMIVAALTMPVSTFKSCSGTDSVAKIKAATLEQCQAVPALEAAYGILKDGGAVKVSTAKKVDAAILGIRAFCDSAQSLEPGNALVTAALLYLRLAQAVKQAQDEA